jgi:uncharacterized protein DUF6879
MLDRVREVAGTRLDRKSYHEHMRVETSRVNGTVWKLERSQFFTEAAGDLAWAAFVSGDWLKSLAIFDSERPDIQAEAEKYSRQGSELRRLRIVESPVSAYLQWELQSLRIADESGMPVRILDAALIHDLEDGAQLPELLIVGDEVLYDVQYDSQWSACGARRITDRDIIREAAAEMSGLWAMAEPLATYFAREIAPLPPPPAN